MSEPRESLSWSVSAVAQCSIARACFRVAQGYKADDSPDADLKALAKFMRLLSDYDEARAHMIDELFERVLTDAGVNLKAGMTIEHIDGNPSNNDPANLRLMDPKENR